MEHDLVQREVTRERVVATIVRLLELSLVRVGNEEYARVNGSYGLTTMRRRHAHVEGHRLELTFRGKSGKLHCAQVEDRRVARAVRQLQELPGQVLFRYAGPDGELCPVGSDPAVITAFEDGSLSERWHAASRRAPRLLTADERRFLAFVRRGTRRHAALRSAA